jgi:hypothetical protein
MDFAFWGYFKSKVYSVKITNLQHLKESIVQAVSSINADMLENIQRNMVYRLQTCSEIGSGHFEQIL